MNSREAIWSALADKLVSVAGIETFSRRWKPYSDTNAQEMPALFQVQSGEKAEIRAGSLTKWTLTGELWLYVSTTGDKTGSVPSTIYNPIVDAIVNILIPADLSAQTLYGLVGRCLIEGNIKYYDGVLEEVALVSIPITILT